MAIIRNHHICIFSVEATDACLASYRIEYGQGTVTRVRNYFINKKAMARKLEIPYRSLLRVFNGYSYPGDIQRTMNAIATYCMAQCM